MNREIIFRCMRCSLKYKGQEPWVYGYLVESTDSWKGRKPHKSWIISRPYSNGGWFALSNRTAVQDETVGQYTGIKDKNGKMIFEGDLVKYTRYKVRSEYIKEDVIEDVYVVYWNEKKHAFYCTTKFESGGGASGYLVFHDERAEKEEIEVIGNIHEQNYQL